MYTREIPTPRGETELPIRLAQPEDLSPRPKHKRGSKCILGKLWEKHPNVPFLPASAFEPTEKELRKAARIQKEIDRNWRNRIQREHRLNNLEKERERKRIYEREARKDPVKLAKRRKAYTKYNHSEKGKANRKKYEASHGAKYQASRNARLRERYNTDPEYRERKKAYNRERYARVGTTREEKDRRNARRKERYRTDPEYREKAKGRANRDYQRKKK